REYIWEIEHHGNLLNKHGFARLAAALRDADRAALTKILAEDFTGIDLGKPQRTQVVAKHVQVERLQDSGQTPVPLKRDAFVERLLELRKVFGKNTPGVKFALRNLGPKVRGKFDSVWEVTTQLRL